MPGRALALLLVAPSLVAGCAYTSHATVKSELGAARSSTELAALLSTPGPITLETVDSDWQVPLSGLLNLDHPTTKSAGLVDRMEPIVVQFHVLRHPERGVFLVDTGVERAVHDDTAAVRGLLAGGGGGHHAAAEARAARVPRRGAFRRAARRRVPDPRPLRPRVRPARRAEGTALYAGPGEAAKTAALNVVIAPNIDRLFAGHGPLRERAYAPEPGGAFDAVLDVFGDGSLWALWVPGHTTGNTAYLVRTPEGPVLLTGDTSHTRWGWDHGVEPGTYSEDPARSAASFRRLQAFARAHPDIEVPVGHQC